MEYGDETFYLVGDHGQPEAIVDDDAGIGGSLGGTLDEPEEPPGTPDDHGTPDEHGGGGDHGGPDHPVPDGHMYVDYEGIEYDAGTIDVDRNHDGRVDTAVIRGHGQVEYYTDRDGDGQADELTITRPDGRLISHETTDAAGHWHETPFPEHHPAGAGGGHIAVDYNGTRYDAGQATVDATGDGRPDTAVIRSPGQVEYYVDRDGDGRADELTITTPDGRLISHEEADPKTGRWHETPFNGQVPGRS